MELDEFGVAGVGHKTEGVDTETIDVTERTGNSVTRHSPKDGVQGTWLATEEVPGRVMSSLGLGNLIIGTWLNGMDEIGEENSILNEKDGDVVANNI